MPATDLDATPTGTPAGVASSRRGIVVAAVVVAWALLAGTRWWAVDVFVVPSASMEPTLRPGDRILVDKTAGEPRRGDVVVVDAASFGQSDPRPALVQGLGLVLGSEPGAHLVKRVIGVPGDRVRCCDDRGRVTVGGVPQTEPYLFPGDTPSDVRFDVTVPPGRLWVMGDHRSRSADSRSRLGSPGGGMVPERDVTGRVTRVVWPPGAWQHPITTPSTVTTGGHR